MVVVALASLVATVAIPLMTKAVIDGPVRHQDQHGLWVLGAAAMGVGISEAVLWFIRRWLVARATMGVEADIRKDLYARLQILPMSFHGRWQSGQLLSRIMNDLSTIRRFMSFGMVFLLLNVIQITVVTAILLAMYWPLGVVVLVSIVPITLTVLHFQQEYTRLSRLAQDQSGHVATHVEESALGVRVVKSFGREDYVYDRFDEQLTDLYDTQVSRVSVSAKFWTLLEVIPNLTLIVVLGFGAYAAGHGYVTMGTLVAFITMMLSLVWPIASLGFLLSMTQESFTAANRIAEIFDAPREITDGPSNEAPRGGRLELVDVGFRFPDAATTTGRCATSTSPSNRGRRWRWSARRVRASRCWPRCCRGCTTSPRARSASTATTSASCRLPALRQAVATAFEDPTLFSMSVAENLRLGRPDATDEQLAQAIEVAAAQFVYDLPFGLDTRIGEQGMSLSGGQRQRLSLARAILAAPEDPGARRHAVRARRAHRGRRRGGAAPGAALGDRHRRRAPRVDGAARRQGRAARGRHDHPRRHARRTAGQRAAVPLPAGRRRRTRRRRRTQLRMGGRRGPQPARPGRTRSRRPDKARGASDDDVAS